MFVLLKPQHLKKKILVPSSVVNIFRCKKAKLRMTDFEFGVD